MTEAGAKKKGGKGIRFALYAVFALAFIASTLWVILQAIERPDPERIMARIPIGSSVDSLRALYDERGLSPGPVMQWFRVAGAKADRSDIQLRVDGATISTEHGIFHQKILGNYAEWRPSSELQSNFTGEITFFVEGSFTESIMIGFVFINGRMVEEEWGYLPG